MKFYKRSIAGFTLVELQISLLLVSMMAVLITGALRISSQTWTKVTQRQDISEHRFLVSRYLRRHLSNARFVRVPLENLGSAMSFFGNEEQLHFIAPYPTFHQDGELYWWTLKLEWHDEAEHFNLITTHFPYSKGSVLQFNNEEGLYAENVEPVRMIVAEDIAVLELEYFSRDKEGVEEWTREWEPGNETPLIIRVNIAQASETGGASPLPEIVIMPRFANQKIHSVITD